MIVAIRVGARCGSVQPSDAHMTVGEITCLELFQTALNLASKVM